LLYVKKNSGLRAAFFVWTEVHIYYGRILGKVLHNEEGMNLEQLRAGLAWHYKQYQKEQSLEDRELLSNAETEAREKSGACDTILHQVIGIS
jgi:endonuclease YncB( thermonuclease family)